MVLSTRLKLALVLAVALGIGTNAQDGPLTNGANLATRTDANAYLLVAEQTYTSPDGPLTNLANVLVRTDANGYLIVTNPVAFGSGSSAPTDAEYWVAAANSTLTAEVDLSALSTGLVLNTGGTPSQYAGTSCTNQFTRSLDSSAAATCASVILTTDTTGTLDHGTALTGLADDDHTQYLLASGTRALTGNWDVGAFTVTGTRFISDITTGTAPFTVASTTVVTNLNADLLDGVQGSGYVLTSRTLTGGVGIAAIGDLSADRTVTLDLNELGNETAIASGDFIAIVDITDSGSQKITFANFEGDLNHDSLTGFVSDEHVAHGGVTLTAGVGLSGGGTIASNRTFTVDLNELTTETAIATGDFLAMVDITDSGSGKITLANLGSGIAGSVDHGGLAGLADDDHTQYLLADGSRALTANWDVGAFDIRAATLTPDGITLGSVLFAGTNGVISQSNANFFWSVSNIRLGLGTSAPDEQLHLTATNPAIQFIGGDIAMTTGEEFASVHFGGGSADSGENAEAAVIRAVADADWTVTPDSPTRLEFLTTPFGSNSPTLHMTIAAGGLVTFTGGLIIGSDVASDTDSTDDLGTTSVRWANLFADAIGDSSQTLTSNAASITLAADTDFILTGGTNGMSIDGTTFSIDGANDRVGIGTAAPGEIVDIESASGLDGATPVTLVLHSTNAGVWTNNAVFSRLDFSTADTSGGTAGTHARIAAFADNTAGSDVGLDFSTTTSSADDLTVRMRLDHVGRLGLGVLLPLTLLHLVAAGPELYIETSSTANATMIIEDTDESGCTGLTVLDGVATFATVSCP